MAFKLVIGDVIDVPVKGSVKDGANTVPFSFTVQAKRLPASDLADILRPDSDVLVRDLLREHVRGWRGQRLVLDDSDAPAVFGPESFACLLDVAGMQSAIWIAYLKALQVSDTPAGRAGN